MRTVSSDKVIFSFSPKHAVAERVGVGELVVLKTEDAFGGQIKSDADSVEALDWSKVDGATGPIFIENADPGDTLVVEVVDIKIPDNGVIVTVPKQGILAERGIKPLTRTVKIRGNIVEFGDVKLVARPMIGTIGVTPLGEIPCGSLGNHGGNMDVKELTVGTRLYLPVFVEGGLFAAGDVHAVQADGELCVSAVEVPAEITLIFSLVKGKSASWPILETKDSFAFLACGETLDEASEQATLAAVEVLMREHGWSFEEAYMFCSLCVDLRINQVVDPKRGVRAVISKNHVGLGSVLARCSTRSSESLKSAE